MPDKDIDIEKKRTGRFTERYRSKYPGRFSGRRICRSGTYP